jgi:regulatory protein
MASPLQEGMNVAYRLLAYRDRSKGEIRDALRKREYDGGTIEKIVTELTGNGYLDDEKFARVYGGFLARNRKVGPFYILDKLYRKSVPKEVAQEAVEEIFADKERVEKEIAAWIEKKLPKLKSGLSPIQRKKRLYDFLSSKGFIAESIFKVLERMGL